MDNNRRRMHSALGDRDLGSSRENTRVIQVEDSSYDNDEQENLDQLDQLEQIAALRQKLQVSKPTPKKNDPAPRAAVSRLEILVGIGRLTTEVEINGVIFGLRSLKAGEKRKVMEASVMQPSELEKILAIREYELAYALFEIDNQPINTYVEDKIFNKVKLIQDLEEHIVSKLWTEYGNMLKVHNESLNKDLGGTSEEIIENIKK